MAREAPETEQLFTIAFLSAHFGLSHAVVTEAIRNLDMRPRVVVNAIEFYDGDAYGHLHCHLADTGAIEHQEIRFNAEGVEVHAEEAEARE